MYRLSVGSTFGSDDYMDTYFSVTPAGSAATCLAAFSAGDGLRDLRVSTVAIQPLSEEWGIGGDLM